MFNTVFLRDLIVIKNGKDYKHLGTGEVPVYGSGGIVTHVDSFLNNGESILLPRKGTLDNIMYVNGPFWTVDTMYWSKVNSKKVYPKYLYCYLSLLDLSCRDSGSTLPSMTFDSYYSLPIKLPEYQLQKRIGDWYFEIEGKIENNNTIAADLEDMAKLLYDYWFVQFDFPNKDGRPYKSSGGKMVWNEELKREIPEGWTVGNLYDVADFINGLACQRFRPEDGAECLPVIKIGEMHDGITEKTERVCMDIPEKNIIHDGDILFSWSATLETMIWTGGTGGLNQHIFKVVPKVCGKHFVYQQLSAYIINFVKMAESRKTTMGHITTDHLKQSRIPLPPDAIISLYEKKVKDSYALIINCKQDNRQLVSFRSLILPMLINGQVGFKEVC